MIESTQPGTRVSDRAGGPPASVAIANSVVGLYKDVLGRGPTKARANFVWTDVLVVVLENTITVAERNLVALGNSEQVREMRAEFARFLEPKLREVVERGLDRHVVTVISGFDPERDIAVELFVLRAASDRS